MAQQGLLPSVDDPKIWQVRVKRNHERIAVVALLNKSIDFQRRGQPLSILSVTSSDSTEGYIFVEAFKEIHVRQACEGLHFMLHKYILVPTEEMPEVYANQKARDSDLRPNQWVRIKNSSAYNGDVALVEDVSDNKVWLRLIPRVDLSAT